MTWEIVVGLIAIVGFGISVSAPIVKLNTNITKLNCSIGFLNENMAESKERISEHGKEIDELKSRMIVLEGFHDEKEKRDIYENTF